MKFGFTISTSKATKVIEHFYFLLKSIKSKIVLCKDVLKVEVWVHSFFDSRLDRYEMPNPLSGKKSEDKYFWCVTAGLNSVMEIMKTVPAENRSPIFQLYGVFHLKRNSDYHTPIASRTKRRHRMQYWIPSAVTRWWNWWTAWNRYDSNSSCFVDQRELVADKHFLHPAML